MNMCHSDVVGEFYEGFQFSKGIEEVMKCLYLVSTSVPNNANEIPVHFVNGPSLQ